MTRNGMLAMLETIRHAEQLANAHGDRKLAGDLYSVGLELGRMWQILDGAERYATHDPGVDWPSPKHTDPCDAIMAALDETREAIALGGDAPR